MKKTEDTARELCAIDLRNRNVNEADIPALVDRYWPVLANEIRQGIVDGVWPFSAEEIETMTAEYLELIKEP
ncbi:hypothetical protein EV667_3013 [Ancylobacter aquaticus]|uniref:Uncharacterized protein n=1 Tax=Ancylobacter aquaticus TaxID=100 RepID=A0A4R1I5I0_ANCAQ|nr:hypothetical protein [Ancylobacter aquaticus]TCK28995.1 hypothetical protein EV667_3013 [Ancylobacter aquaticus]